MGNAADDTDRLGRTKAEFLILYRSEPESIELKQAMERLNKQAAELGISMDDIDTATFSHLERNHFCFHEVIRPPPPVEDLLIHDVLLAWCAIHAEGRLRAWTQVDPTPQVHVGTIGSWAEWSGSRWVDARKRSIQQKGVTCLEAHLHCSLPPGMKPRAERHHEIIQNYGRWISETEWAPPPTWSDEVKQVITHAWSLTSEAMSTQQVLLAWRAIYAEGGLLINTTRHVPGSVPFWSGWSGSAWVARLEQKLREEHNSVASVGGPHLALPPGWEPQSEAELEKVQKFGKWVTEADWEPPPVRSGPDSGG